MSQGNRKLMVMAGGTGGHVYPALAVAQVLRENNTEITWLGTQRGLEATIVPTHNIAMEWVSVEGLRGKGVLAWAFAPFKLLRAMWQSSRAIRKVQPDCVLGMGGFVSGPGGLVARLLGKPLVIHEQNAAAGLTNRYLAKIANRVLTGFPNVDDLPAHAQWVGNPVRSEIFAGPAKLDSQNINVLVIGGSQGARSFNLHLPTVFSKQSGNVQIWHQSGKDESETVAARYQKLGLDAKVSDFINDMAAAYEWADLLICRAGAMTIAECCAAAKPAVLIPFPFSAGDHQQKNAQAVVDVGGAIMLDNALIDELEMTNQLTVLLADRDLLKAMGQQAATLHKKDAVQSVVKVCEEYLNA